MGDLLCALPEEEQVWLREINIRKNEEL